MDDKQECRRSLNRFGALVTASTIRLWMSSLDFRGSFYDPSVDPVHPDYAGPKIYIFWHEYILLPFYLRGHCNLTMLVSQHRDADVLTESADLLGFEVVRGSSFRGGSAALRELVRKSRSKNLAITPDGPRGPRRRMAQGPIYLASKLGLPLVVMGVGYDRPWRFSTWDRFGVPRPYSRARLVAGPPLTLPSRLDREGVERYRQEIEQLLNRLTLEAEAWAEAGTAKVGELALRREAVIRSKAEGLNWPQPETFRPRKLSPYAADVDAAA
jgi:lysophospholipid acyltransferase (LPLAT)-like uncharacterized protein